MYFNETHLGVFGSKGEQAKTLGEQGDHSKTFGDMGSKTDFWGYWGDPKMLKFMHKMLQILEISPKKLFSILGNSSKLLGIWGAQ